MKFNIGKLLKREIILTLVTVTLLSMGVMLFSYSYFMDVDEGTTNVMSFGDISLSFCADETCSSMSGLGNLIGTKIDGDRIVPQEIYPMSDADGLNTDPYKFVITNNGNYNLYMNFILTPDTSFTSDEYAETDYSQIKISISEEEKTNPLVSTGIYTDFPNGVILENQFIQPGQTKIYSLRSWVSESAINTVQKTYFVVNLRVEGSYKPEQSEQ